MNPKEQFIDFLRHYRHDWLNQIQIMKGYLTMGKLDDLDYFLDQVIVNAHMESRVFLLGHEELIYYLLTYNWIQDKIMLEVEIECDQEEAAKLSQHPYLLEWVREVTSIMEEGCHAESKNRLFFLFRWLEGEACLQVEFEGQWNMGIGEKRLGDLQDLVAQNQGKLMFSIQTEQAVAFDIYW